MGQKKFAVRFYRGGAITGAAKVSETLQKLHDDWQQGTALPHVSAGAVGYELRDFRSINGGKVFMGVLAVLRDEAPNIRDNGGVERPISLQPGDTVIEKNHFIFYKDRELLVWQINARASHVSRFEQYLSQASGAMIGFDDILQAASFKRINDGVVKKLEFRIAMPKNPDLVPSNDWTAQAMRMMSGAGAMSIKIDMSTRSRTGLAGGVKQVIRQLKDSSEAKSIRVKLAEDGDPIDLVADSIKGWISVNMVGMYPDINDMFAQLGVLKDEKKSQLDEFFGQGSRVLD